MANKNGTLEASNGWTFELDNFTAGEFETLNDALRNTRVSEIAEIMPRITAACPYGDAKDPATYKNIPIKQFLTLGKALTEALQEDSKK